MPICCPGRSIAALSRPSRRFRSPLRGVWIPPPRGPFPTLSAAFCDPLRRSRCGASRPPGAPSFFFTPSPADRLRLIGVRSSGGFAVLSPLPRPLGAVSEVGLFPYRLRVAAQWARVFRSSLVSAISSSRPVGAACLRTFYRCGGSLPARWARVVSSCIVVSSSSARPVGAAWFLERNRCGRRLRAHWARHVFLADPAGPPPPRLAAADRPSVTVFIRSARWARCVASRLLIASASSPRRPLPSCCGFRRPHSWRLVARVFIAFRLSVAARLSSRPWARPLRPRPSMLRASTAPTGRGVSPRSCFARDGLVAPTGRARRSAASWSSMRPRARRAPCPSGVSVGGLSSARSPRAAFVLSRSAPRLGTPRALASSST